MQTELDERIYTTDDTIYRSDETRYEQADVIVNLSETKFSFVRFSRSRE